MAIIVKRHIGRITGALMVDPESGATIVNNKAGRKVPRAEQLRRMRESAALRPVIEWPDEAPF